MVVYDRSHYYSLKNETVVPERYMDMDGALNYELGEEPEDLNAPANVANTTLLSVSHDDERKHTPEEWAKILNLIDEGKVFWEDFINPDFRTPRGKFAFCYCAFLQNFRGAE